MAQAPFRAKDFSVAAQTFLYACAFWTVAADEELKPGEQTWLYEQFGQEGATQSLEEFVALESDEFFAAFDNAAAGLSDEEKNIIFPKLEEWLISCAKSDAEELVSEDEIIQKIKARLSIDEKAAASSGAALRSRH